MLRNVAVVVMVGTAAVRVAATLAVCTIKVLMALAFRGGTEVAADGTQAMINTKAVSQSASFFPVGCMFIHSHQIYGVAAVVGVSDGKGVRVSVGVDGMGVDVDVDGIDVDGMVVSVGTPVGGKGVRVGVRRVGSMVGVGRLMVNETRFSA